MMTDSPLISIVIPAYNAEKYIGKCIESIIKQTYKNWELIIVDDGSTDSTLAVSKEIQNTDSRIHIVSKGNGGVSSARNFGIEVASGDWICFVDSDDYIENSYLEDFKIDEGIELYVQGYKKINSHGNVKIFENQDYGIKDRLDAFKIMESGNITMRSAGFKLYDLNIIRKHKIYFDLRFQSGEDHLFTLNYFFYCNRIKFLNSNGYCYVDNNDGSLSKRNIPVVKVLNYLLCVKYYQKRIFYNDVLFDYQSSIIINRNTAEILLLIIKSFINENTSRKEQNFVKHTVKEYLNPQGVAFKFKIFYFIFLYNIPLKKSIYKLLFNIDYFLKRANLIKR